MRNIVIHRTLFLLFCLVSLLSAGWATTWNVPIGASLATIQGIINSAAAGDTISFAASGTYNLTGSLSDTTTNNLTLLGNGCTLNLTATSYNSLFYLNDVSGVTISDFIFNGSTYGGEIWIDPDCNALTITENTIENNQYNGTDGRMANGIYSAEDSNGLGLTNSYITFNTIHDIIGGGINLYGPGSNTQITDNTFYNIPNDQISPKFDGAGAYISNNVVFARNVGVNGCGRYGIEMGGWADGPNETVTSLTSSGTTAYVTTAAPHGLSTGAYVYISGATQTEYNGTFQITVTGASTFTYPLAGSTTSPATGTIIVNLAEYTCSNMIIDSNIFSESYANGAEGALSLVSASNGTMVTNNILTLLPVLASGGCGWIEADSDANIPLNMTIKDNVMTTSQQNGPDSGIYTNYVYNEGIIAENNLFVNATTPISEGNSTNCLGAPDVWQNNWAYGSTFSQANNSSLNGSCPTMSISGAQNGAADGLFTITSSIAPAQATPVTYAVSGAAEAGTDYQALSGTATIPVGETSVTVPVTHLSSGDGTVPVIATLTLGPYYINSASKTATVNINTSGSSSGPTVTVAASPSSINELNGTSTYTISASPAPTANLTVNYTMSGTAVSGTDYQPLTGSVTIPSGATTGAVTLTTIDRHLLSGNVTAQMVLETSSTYTVGAPSSATVTILDNDNGGGVLTGGSVTAATSTYNLTSLGATDWSHWNNTGWIHKATGDSQISNVTQIGGGTYGNWDDTSRNVSWSDGTPTGSDSDDMYYYWCNGTVNAGWTFTAPADTTSRTLSVMWGGAAGAGVKLNAHLSDGSAADYTDAFTCGSSITTRLETITYQAASAGQTLTITLTNTTGSSPSVDLDAAWLTTAALPAVSVSASPTSINEASGSSTFTVTRTGSTSSALTVTYTMSGTATSGTDYTALTGSVTIASGATTGTVTLTALDRDLSSGSCTATLTLTPNADYTVGTPNSATVTINDNDAALTGVTVTTPSSTSPLPLTQTPANGITIQATPIGGGQVEYDFGYCAFNSATVSYGNFISLSNGYTLNTTCQWTPTQGGDYALEVLAREVGSTAYCQVYGCEEFTISTPTTLTAVAVTTPGTGNAVNLTNVPPDGITIKATPTGGDSNVEYLFGYCLYDATNSVWGAFMPIGTGTYTTGTTCTWTPTQAGMYALEVLACEQGSNVYCQVYGNKGIDIVSAGVTGVTLQADPAHPTPQPAATAITLTAVPQATVPVEYEFICSTYDTTTQTWGPYLPINGGYQDGATCVWTPAQAGIYTLGVYMRAQGSNTPYDVYALTGYYITP